MGFCLALANELSKETRADKARDFIGKGHPGRKQKGKGTYVDGISFWVVFSQSILTQSTFWWCMPCSTKMDTSEDSGSWLDMWCHILTFPEQFQLVVAY